MSGYYYIEYIQQQKQNTSVQWGIPNWEPTTSQSSCAVFVSLSRESSSFTASACVGIGIDTGEIKSLFC